MKLGANLPMGPLELADYIGLDVCHEILTNLSSAHGARFAPSDGLRQLVEAGCLGKKSGKGFY